MLRSTCDWCGSYRIVKNMYAEYSEPDTELSSHQLLMAHLFFPEGEVTPEILEIAMQRAEGQNLMNDKMIGLAYYQIGKDRELPSINSAWFVN